MKRKIKISPLQVQKLVKKIIKEDAGKDTPGGNPEYFYDDKWKEMRDKDDSPETEEIELESSEENNIIKNIPYKGGQLVLEYETMFGTPKYMIYFDTEEGDNTNKIVAELDSEFFDEQMSQTILEYIKTRE